MVYYVKRKTLINKNCRFIKRNFSQIALDQTFKDLTLQEVTKILETDGLYVNSEDTIALAILNWCSDERDGGTFALFDSKFKLKVFLHYK